MTTNRPPPPYPFTLGPRESGRCRVIYRAVGGWWLGREDIVEWFPARTIDASGGEGFRHRVLNLKAERPGDLLSGVYPADSDEIACAAITP